MVRFLQDAKGFLFPGLDDFGITPLEAMAAGTPVLAYKAGGALDYVVPGKTGLFFDEQTVASVVACIKLAEKKKWNPQTMVKKAEQFSPKHFKTKMKKFVDAEYAKKLDQ